MDTAFWDVGNAVFEGVGAVLTWQNVRMLLRHRIIRGIDWRVTAFWATWGLWNLGFYGPGMGLWLSWWMGVVLVAGNITWVALAIRYRWENKCFELEKRLRELTEDVPDKPYSDYPGNPAYPVEVPIEKGEPAPYRCALTAAEVNILGEAANRLDALAGEAETVGGNRRSLALANDLKRLANKIAGGRS